MAFYENNIVTKHLAEKELQKLEKYSKLINESGKVIKIEDWGLLNLSNKMKITEKAFIFIAISRQ